jgi:putative selenium metabolism protein SsnA
MSAPLLIVHGLVVTGVPGAAPLADGAVHVRHGLVDAIGPSAELIARFPGTPRLDARGQWVMPGRICAHTHLYAAFARGLAPPGAPPRDFPEILERLWWSLDQALDRESVRCSALLGLADAIRHGTTTLFDHHASSNAVSGSLDAIAQAVEDAGVRAVLSYEVTDRHGPQGAADAIVENVRFLRAAKGHPRVAAAFGLHALLTLSPQTLAAGVAATRGMDTGFHLHAAEHEADQAHSLRTTGKRVVQQLHDAGLLGERSIVAHAVHVDASEIALLRDTQTWVAHQPRSNMLNGVGVADVHALLEQGVRVCMGDDGCGGGMAAEWQAAALAQKSRHRDPRRGDAASILQMAVQHNAALAACYFPASPPGLLVPGGAADVIFVDYDAPTPVSADNLPDHLLWGCDDSRVTTTICAGRVLMHERRLLTLDEAAVAAQARELSPSVWRRYEEFARASASCSLSQRLSQGRL